MNSSAPHQDQAHADAQFLSCDVLIVGGGISGIAIAERLAREAREQNISRSILVADRGEQFGSEASSGLEGWYHTGFVYIKSEKPRIFTTCLNAFEDLYNFYSLDVRFDSHTHCNIHLPSDEDDDALPGYPRHDTNDQAWFLHAIKYELRGQDTSSGDPQSARYQREWDNICSRMARIAQALRQWQRKPNGWKRNGYCEVPDLSRCWAPAETSPPPAQPYQSMDAAMNSHQLLCDLARSALKNGVKFLPRYEMREESVHLSRDAFGEIDGVILHSTASLDRICVLAKQYIFTLGAGFERTRVLSRLDIEARTWRRRSVILAAKPATEDESFVCLGQQSDADFNHIVQEARGKDGESMFSYSLVSDSNSLPEGSEYEECAEVAFRLRAKASVSGQTSFWPKASEAFRILPDARVSWYACDKTEFALEEGTNREYSYWWGAAWWYEGDSEDWQRARSLDQRQAQECIRKYAETWDNRTNPPDNLKIRIEGETMTNWLGEGKHKDLPLRESVWALKKLLHFIILRSIREHRERNHARENANSLSYLENVPYILSARKFFVNQLKKRDEENQRNKENPGKPRRNNYLCVVPGKFSLFASFAHQVYLEMIARGFFEDETPSREKLIDLPRDKCNAIVDHLIAEPRATGLLSKESPLLPPRPSVNDVDSKH